MKRDGTSAIKFEQGVSFSFTLLLELYGQNDSIGRVLRHLLHEYDMKPPDATFYEGR